MIASLILDSKEFGAGLTEANAKMAETEASGGKSFGGLSSVGKVALVAVAAATIAVAVAAVDMGVKYEAASAKLAANAGISVDAANQIGQAFLSQAF